MARPKKFETQTDYKRQFGERAYDRLAITIPKGRKQAVEAHAKVKGESVNGLVNALLRADMGLTEAQWKEQTKEEG